MNIVSLKIKNFLSISDVEIKPGKVNQVVGANNQGKTSILKALEFAIKGSADGSLVKLGEETAEVVIELDDTTTIRRRLSAEGKQSVAVKKEGLAATSPQTYLDSLFEHSAFNPLELLDPKKRHDAILNSIDLKLDANTLGAELGMNTEELPPLDYGTHALKVLDQAHRYFYQRRAEQNRIVAEKKKKFETYKADLPKIPSAAPTREETTKAISELEQQYNNVVSLDGQVKQTKARAEKFKAELSKIDFEILSATQAFEKNIAALKARKEAGTKVLDQTLAEIPSNGDQTEVALNDIKLRLEKAKGNLAVVEQIEAIMKQTQMVEDLRKEVDEAEFVAKSMTKTVESLAGPIKKKLMESAEMPITGLSYEDGQFMVDNVPVDNLSSSKALKLSLGVARKLAKKTKVICIDGAELLDGGTYEELRKEINDDGFTYFITKVGIPFVSRKEDAVIPMQNGGISR